MAFTEWQATVQDDFGNIVPSPVVTVRNAADDSLATIYNLSGVEIGNPITGDINGFVQFQVYPGKYYAEGVKDGSNTEDQYFDAPVGFLNLSDFVTAVADGWTIAGGTVVTIGSLSWMVIPVGHADYGTDPISDLPGWMAVGEWTPEHHGASGDGATDDTVALQEWLDAVGGDVAQADPSKVYVISDTLSVSGVGLRLRGKLRLFKNSNGKALELQNTVSGPYSLASDYAAGDLSIDLTGSPLAAAPKSGQAFKIVSDAVDPRNRDEGSSASQYRSGEWFVVGEGSTTTNLVLQAPLQFSTGISPTSTAGDEARIDAYTTAMAARVVMIDMDAAVEIDGIEVEYEDGHEGDPWTGDAVRVVGYADPKITFAVARSYGPGLSMCNYGGEVRGTARRCEDNTAQGQYGYGVSDNGSFGLKVYGLTGHDNRHLYTSAATRLAAGEADAIKLLGAGRTQSAQIIGGHGSGGEVSVWDTHQSSDGAQFSSIVATASTGYAGSFRGRDVSVSNLTARGTYRGVQFFTEYDSGDADDDLFVAGKTVDDFSSGALTDARIECRDHVIKVSHADVEVSGNGEYVSEDHTLLKQEGGRVVISGTHKFKVTGADGDAGISIFDLDNVNAAASAVWGVTELVIAPGAYIEIDATAGATGLDLFGLEANSRVICYGTIIADVPDATSSFSNGAGDANVYVSGNGLIIYKEAGVVAKVKSFAPLRPEHFGALGDGESDDTDAINDFLNHLQAYSAKGEGFGRYSITTDYVMTAAIDLNLRGSEILQQTDGRGFLQLRADGNKVRNVHVTLDTTRTNASGYYRGYSADQRMCAVWVEGGSNVIENISSTNMFNTVCLRGPVVEDAGGAGYTGADTDPPTAFHFTSLVSYNRVSNIGGYSQDFCVTGHQQDSLELRGYKLTSVTDVAGIPPHAIYMTNADGASCTRCVISGGFCDDGTTGVGHKLEYFTQSKVSDLTGTGTAGATQLVEFVDCRVSDIASLEGDDTDGGSMFGIYLNGGSGSILDGFYHSSATDSPQGGVVVLNGGDWDVQNVKIVSRFPASGTVAGAAAIRAEDTAVVRAYNVDYDVQGSDRVEPFVTAGASTATIEVSGYSSRNTTQLANGAGGDITIYGDANRIENFDSLSMSGSVTFIGPNIEKGTFTPEFTPNSGAFTTVTYDQQYGYYVWDKGRAVVDVWAAVRTDLITVGTASGQVKITGLPLTASDTAVASAGRGYACSTVAFGFTTSPNQAVVEMNTTTAILYTNGTTTQVGDLATGANSNTLQIHCAYPVK